MRIAFTVEGPPIPCARARVTRFGSYLPERSRAYQEHVKMTAMLAAYQLKQAWNARAKTYGIELRFFKANHGRADFDNLAKSVTDALTKLLYPDDSAIVRALITVEVDRGRPRAEVELEVLAS